MSSLQQLLLLAMALVAVAPATPGRAAAAKPFQILYDPWAGPIVRWTDDSRPGYELSVYDRGQEALLALGLIPATGIVAGVSPLSSPPPLGPFEEPAGATGTVGVTDTLTETAVGDEEATIFARTTAAPLRRRQLWRHANVVDADVYRRTFLPYFSQALAGRDTPTVRETEVALSEQPVYALSKRTAYVLTPKKVEYLERRVVPQPIIQKTYQVVPPPVVNNFLKVVPPPVVRKFYQVNPPPVVQRVYNVLPSPIIKKSFEVVPPPVVKKYYQILPAPIVKKSDVVVPPPVIKKIFNVQPTPVIHRHFNVLPAPVVRKLYQLLPPPVINKYITPPPVVRRLIVSPPPVIKRVVVSPPPIVKNFYVSQPLTEKEFHAGSSAPNSVKNIFNVFKMMPPMLQQVERAAGAAAPELAVEAVAAAGATSPAASAAPPLAVVPARAASMESPVKPAEQSKSDGAKTMREARVIDSASKTNLAEAQQAEEVVTDVVDTTEVPVKEVEVEVPGVKSVGKVVVVETVRRVVNQATFDNVENSSAPPPGRSEETITEPDGTVRKLERYIVYDQVPTTTKIVTRVPDLERSSHFLASRPLSGQRVPAWRDNRAYKSSSSHSKAVSALASASHSSSSSSLSASRSSSSSSSSLASDASARGEVSDALIVDPVLNERIKQQLLLSTGDVVSVASSYGGDTARVAASLPAGATSRADRLSAASSSRVESHSERSEVDSAAAVGVAEVRNPLAGGTVVTRFQEPSVTGVPPVKEAVTVLAATAGMTEGPVTAPSPAT